MVYCFLICSGRQSGAQDVWFTVYCFALIANLVLKMCGLLFTVLPWSPIWCTRCVVYCLLFCPGRQSDPPDVWFTVTVLLSATQKQNKWHRINVIESMESNPWNRINGIESMASGQWNRFNGVESMESHTKCQRLDDSCEKFFTSSK